MNFTWWLYGTPLWISGPAMLVILLVAMEAGRAYGRRVRRTHEEEARTAGGDVTVTALLGLLGLLLAFTYSFSLARYDQRKDALVAEVNALGTAFHRADLLFEPGATELQRRLLDYARTRQTTAEMFSTPERTQETIGKTTEAQAALWPATREALTAEVPAPVATSVVAAINTVLDVHTQRVMAGFDNIPPPVVILLVVVSALSLSMAAYNSTLQENFSRGRFIAFALVLVALVLIIMDFDMPLSGLIRVPREGLTDLIANMEEGLGL